MNGITAMQFGIRSCGRLIMILALAGNAAPAPAQTAQFLISTFAGAPLAATPVAALSVAIGSPRGIATDTAGTVYFTTALQTGGGNAYGLLKLDQNGILTRMTGSQLDNVGGLAVDKSGNAYLAGSGVVKVSSDGAVTTIASGLGQLCSSLVRQDWWPWMPEAISTSTGR